MVILPKYLYLFQHVPVFIRKTFFTKFDRMIASFLWGSKPARIKKTYLQHPKSLGGMALPNFLNYYWACNILKLLYWSDLEDTPLWARMEMSSSQHSLRSLACSSLPLMSSVTSMPTVSHTLKIWAQFRMHFGLRKPSSYSPIYRNHLFKPSCTDLTFRTWFEKGIRTFEDLYSRGTLSSFSDLSQRFNLPKSHLFRYFQIRHFLQKQSPEFPNQPIHSEIDSILSLDPNAKGLISNIHTEIDSVRPEPVATLKLAWERDLGLELTEVVWGRVLGLVHMSSICARHSLIQCKIVHRIHYTNARLARIFPGTSDACNRCKQSPADLIHMFWTCPHLSEFWTSIFTSFTEIAGVDIPPDPLTALFGVPCGNNTPLYLNRIMSFTSLLARRLILLKWKHVFPPTHFTWIRDVLAHIKLERMRFSLKGSLRNFEKTWIPFLDYVKTLTVVPGDGDD